MSSKARENIAKLPDECYGVLDIDKSLILIKVGENGYYRVGKTYEDYTLALYEAKCTDELADILNAEKGITPAQREAMEIGSMFGWEVPGADPDAYNDLLTSKKETI